ncbi:MAG: SDR family oxidoreductase [Chloroflexi bacterium]|nr:SDR family oxidoreductase [Chloroflexota bacterium]
MERFRSKVVIITGGASGIGRALAEELVKYGATVIIADIREPHPNETTKKVQYVQVDVSQAEQVQALVDQVVHEHGRLDYMFNNAGIGIAGELRDMNLEQWNRIIDVNLRGVVHGVLAAYPVMIRQGYGHLVNTASLAGLIWFPNLGAYSATKHAIVGLSGALRIEAAGLGVKVSVICPGLIQTGILDTTTYLNVTKEFLLKLLPVKGMSAKRAAQLMLKEVLKNKAIINVPFYVNLLWGWQRLSPGLVSLINGITVKVFRRLRKV